MLAVIFFMLKLIGILLLVVLGILILIAASILFVPIRYRIHLMSLPEKTEGEVGVSFAGPLIRGKAGYECGKVLFYSVRILGFLVLTNEDKKTIFEKFSDWKRRRKKRKSEKVRYKKEKKSEEYERKGVKEPTVKKEERRAPVLEEPLLPEKETKQPDLSPQEPFKQKKQETNQPTIEKTLEEQKERWYNKVRARMEKWFRQIGRLLEQSEKKKDEIEEKLEDLFDKIEQLEQFYHKERTAKTMQRMMVLVKKTIAYVVPRTCRGYFRYGFPDPSWTGKLYGILCVSGIALKKGFYVEPDFQETKLETEIFLRGRVRIFFFVRIALKVFFDKELKAVYEEGKEVIGGIRS